MSLFHEWSRMKLTDAAERNDLDPLGHRGHLGSFDLVFQTVFPSHRVALQVHCEKEAEVEDQKEVQRYADSREHDRYGSAWRGARHRRAEACKYSLINYESPFPFREPSTS